MPLHSNFTRCNCNNTSRKLRKGRRGEKAGAIPQICSNAQPARFLLKMLTLRIATSSLLDTVTTRVWSEPP